MYLAAFLLDFSVAVGLTAMPFFIVERINGGAALSGTVGAIQMALYAVGCLGSVRFVARAKNSLTWALGGVAGFGLLFALTPLSNTPAACVMVASIPFLGLALSWPAMQAWLGHEPDLEARARHMAGFNMATAFGFTLSPLFTGPMYDADYRLPFVLLLCLCLMVLGLLLSLFSRNQTALLPEEAPEEKDTATISTGLLYSAWAATFTANGLIAAVRSIYPVHVEALARSQSLTLLGEFRPALFESVGPATLFSWLAFLLSLCTAACFAVMGRTRAWQGRYSILAAGQLLAGISFILLGHTTSLVLMALCFAVVGANFGLCFFASLYYSLANAAQRHGRAAINEGLLGAGGFAGGIGLGYAAEAFGIAASFQWMPVLVLVALGVQLLLFWGGRNACPSPSSDRFKGP